MVSQPVGLGTRVSNGTSRGCPGTLWEGTIYFLVLVSLRPGTRAGAKILGQTPLTRLPGTIWLAKKSKNSNFFFSIFLLAPKDGTGRKNPALARPVARCQNAISASARFWACPVVPLSRDMKRLLSLCPMDKKILSRWKRYLAPQGSY